MHTIRSKQCSITAPCAFGHRPARAGAEVVGADVIDTCVDAARRMRSAPLTRRNDPSSCRPELTVHEHVRLADGSSRRMVSRPCPQVSDPPRVLLSSFFACRFSFFAFRLGPLPNRVIRSSSRSDMLSA